MAIPPDQASTVLPSKGCRRRPGKTSDSPCIAPPRYSPFSPLPQNGPFLTSALPYNDSTSIPTASATPSASPPTRNATHAANVPYFHMSSISVTSTTSSISYTYIPTGPEANLYVKSKDKPSAMTSGPASVPGRRTLARKP